MATTYTLPDGSLLTKPALTDTADIEVINTSMQNLANNITNLDKFVYGGTLPNNTDLNSVIDPGYYLMSSNYTYTNVPSAWKNYYSVLVLRTSRSATAVMQISIGARSVWVRTRTSATNWEAWAQLDNGGAGWINSNYDLNNLTDGGTYGLGTNYTFQHMPTSVTSGYLTVFNPSISGTYVVQRLQTSSGVFYTRVRSNSTWGSWYKFTGTAV